MTRYEPTIQQTHRWGPMKWGGNVTQDDEPTPDSPFVGPPLEERDGWFAWTRHGLERKLRRAVRRYEREDAWREA